MGADAPTARQLRRFPLALNVLFIAIAKQLLNTFRSFVNCHLVYGVLEIDCRYIDFLASK